MLADPAVITVLRNLSAPYPVPAPSAALALAALSGSAIEESSRRCRQAIEERQTLVHRLVKIEGVKRVYASEGNYVLVRFNDAQQAFERLLAAGVVVRDMRSMPRLHDALRISIGTAEENGLLLAALHQEVTA